jgi:hypothetical protein
MENREDFTEFTDFTDFTDFTGCVTKRPPECVVDSGAFMGGRDPSTRWRFTRVATWRLVEECHP